MQAFVEQTYNRKTKLRVLTLVAICALLFILGYVVRYQILKAQYDMHGSDLPFSLESAIQYKNVKTIFETGKLPKIDKNIAYPNGVRIAHTDSVGAEYFYAATALLFPKSIDLTQRIRIITCLWFCLGIPLIFLWVYWETDSLWSAIVAGTFFAVSMAAVMRSTGQELSRENFALPFWFAHMAGVALAWRFKTRFKWLLTSSIVSGLMLGMAIAFWDLIQYYVILWTFSIYVRLVFGHIHSDKNKLVLYFTSFTGLLLAGIIVPYLRAHNFITSWLMLFNYGIFVALIFNVTKPVNTTSTSRSKALQHALRILLPPLILVLGLLIFRGYGEDYSHFSGLLIAKLKFLNKKPMDPSLLTFDQRILWAPALNSASFLLTKKLFLTTVPLSLIAGVVFIFKAGRPGSDRRVFLLLFYFAISLLSFVLFVRMHVFLIVFACALIGHLAKNKGRGLAAKIVISLALAYGTLAEAANTLDTPEKWGSPLPYLSEQKKLVEWLKGHAEGEPILANFGISAFITTYAGNPVILHPKFETLAARTKVREYAETLFRKEEKDLRDWAEATGASYLVYSKGEFANNFIELQLRYCVDAVHQPLNSAARLLEFEHEKSRYFVCQWENFKYKVFRIITATDQLTAADYITKAELFLKEGKPD
ncbi:MAG: hypothetical protein GX811_08775, partial [Lentisphaerae bacterium]|nr:hypothetical protein [Lentisphaerota bacterium]